MVFLSLFNWLQASYGEEPIWSRDESFRPEFSHIEPVHHGLVADFDFQPDNKVVAVGTFTLVNNIVVSNIVRLNFDGTLDTTFPTNLKVNDRILSVVVDPAARIVIAGKFDMVNEQSFPGIARLLPNGEIDPTFKPAFQSHFGASGALRQPDGKLLIYGPFLQPESHENSVPVIRLNEDGSLDDSFVTTLIFGAIDNALGAALQPDGKILLAGSFQFVPNGPYYDLIRLLPDGSADPDFQLRNDVPFIRDIELQPDGRIVVGENSSIFRLLSSGETDASFTAFTDLSSLKTINLQPDGKIGYYGFFTNGLVNSSGALLGTMQVEPRAERFGVHRMRTGPDGNVWISGGITSIDGNAVFGMMRLLPPTVRTYQEWAQQVFPSGSTRTGPDESFADDGIPNVLRYAFSVDPTEALPSPLTTASAGALQVRHNPDAMDLSILVEQAHALGSGEWEPVASKATGGSWSASEEFSINSGTSGELKLTTGEISGQARFFRISVELQNGSEPR